ncbi:MAG: hypothetical protein ACK5TK_12075 [Betaproteobacteria bacterium]
MKPNLSVLHDDIRAIGTCPVSHTGGIIKLDPTENPSGCRGRGRLVLGRGETVV